MLLDLGAALVLIVDSLGVTVAPRFCSAALGLVPLEAVQTLEAHVTAIERLLRLGPSTFRPLAESARTSLLLRFLRRSHMLTGLVAGPFQALEGEPAVCFPCFHEYAHIGLLRLESSLTQQALQTTLPAEAGIQAVDTEQVDLGEALAEFALPPDFLQAWRRVTLATGLAPGAVGAAIALLRSGAYEVQFFPADPATDRAALLFLFFRIYSVVGVYVAEEPFVDPIGLFI